MMTRAMAWGAIVAIATICAGCNQPSCGAGTKQVQDESGDVRCVAADAIAPIACPADGGVHLVGGNCVSEVACGPNTMPQRLGDGTTVCVAGGGPASCVPDCGTPQANRICVNGQVRHLVDNSPLGAGEMVHVALYEPLSFLNDANTPPLAEADTGCGYKFDDVPYPPSMLVVVAVTDAGKRGLATVGNQLTGTGASVVAQQAYQVDSYALPKSLVQSWAATSGIDYIGKGAVVMRFFADAEPSPTQLTATETHPVAGVTTYMDGAPADGSGGHVMARYFGASMMALDPALTTTGPSGTSILSAPVTGVFPTLTGMGGTSMGAPISWQMVPGGSTAQVVFVERL
ncbi:MAG TPA: hypothetical protein VF334_04445, partial [Polyangia bacterium]